MSEVVMEASVGGTLDWGLAAQLVLAAVVLYGLYIVGRGVRRKEINADVARTMELQATEIEALRSANLRLEHELRSTRDELVEARQDIQNLDKRLIDLTRQNHELTALIIGEKVPDAMLKALMDTSTRTIVALQQVFHEELASVLGREGFLDRRGEDRPFSHDDRRAVDD